MSGDTDTLIMYDIPKLGIFERDTNEYGPDGWIQEPVDELIIGEDSDSYITRTFTSTTGYWTEDGLRYEEIEVIAIGPHKSRLIKWKDTQLSLF